MVKTSRSNVRWCLVAVGSIILLGVGSRASAVAIDFSDLTPLSRYPTGSTFASNGVGFEVMGTFGEVIVLGDESDKALNMLRNTSLAVELPANTIHASIDFSAGCRGCGGFSAYVNGIQLPLLNNANALNGVNVPGVQAMYEERAIRSGTLRLDGPIHSLTYYSVGDGTTFVDDLILLSIPEPATQLLVVLSVVGLASTMRSARYTSKKV
jgi:hypothetical protein